MFGSESFDKTTPLLRMYCLLKPCLYINRPYSNRPPIALVNGVCLCYPHTISASYWANETSQKHLNGNLPSLKLTAKTPKKWMVRIRSLPFEMAYFHRLCWFQDQNHPSNFLGCEFSKKKKSTENHAFASPSVCKTTGSEVACSDPIVCLGRLGPRPLHTSHTSP